MLEPLIGDGLFISEGETWRKRRRIVSPIVHSTRLGEIAPVMTETVRDMGERWTILPEGTTIDALAEMAQLTAEIICRSIFGRELGRERSREVVEGFSDFQRAVSRIDFFVPARPPGLGAAATPAFNVPCGPAHPSRH